MSDLIDRNAVMLRVREFIGNPTYDEIMLVNDLNALPSAEPERKWIPVTERLPKTNGCHLVWRPHFFGGEIGMPAICYFDGQNTWHDAYGVDFSRVLYKKDITAWMPLPEPPEDPDDHPDR